MAVRPIDIFDHAIQRADHFITLYDLLSDTRQRSIRSDWASKFQDLMNWPTGEDIIRVDGKNKDSILIMRESIGIDRNHFTHDYLSELLRAALVASVSAMDRYFHELVLRDSIGLLALSEKNIPPRLKGLKIPVLVTKKALSKAKMDKSSRPGHLLKKAIQIALHEKTFQSPNEIGNAIKNMLGVEDFWRKVGKQMPQAPNSESVQKQIKVIAKRRNAIVHEADLILKTKAQEISLNEIDKNTVSKYIKFLKSFIQGTEKVLEDEGYS